MEPQTSHTDDEQLLAAMAEGDQAAVAALYDRHGGTVYGLALRILRDRQLSEEVVQDVFVKAWRAAASFDPARATPITWLMTIAHNSAVDRLRREGARPISDGVELLDSDGSDALDTAASGMRAPDPAELAITADRATIVRETLQRIPPRQREAIELAYFSGLTQAEVAERLHEPVGTIKTRMFHGMRRLRELLTEAGVRDEA